MGRTNGTLTNWQERPHLITMPADSLTYEERARRIAPGRMLWGRIPNPVVAMMEGLRQQATKTYKASIVEVCPGFRMSADQILGASDSLGYRRGTLAHLLELALKHRGLFAKYSRVYAVDGCSSDGPGKPLMLPFVGRISRHGTALEMNVRPIDCMEQIFHGMNPDGLEGFVFLEEAGRLDHLCCAGCGD